MKGLTSALVACVLLLFVDKSFADPFEIKVDQVERGYHNTCKITLRDPISNEILGIYRCGTGGAGRGSAPFTRYKIASFLGLDQDPLNIGERWNLQQLGVGFDEGEVWDERLKDKRTEIELHRCRYSNVTLGCICVIGNLALWQQFETHLRSIFHKVRMITFQLEANPIGSESLAVVAYHELPPIRRAVYKARSKPRYTKASYKHSRRHRRH